jgi:hypothetical protein
MGDKFSPGARARIGCVLHVSKSSPLQRLAMAIELASMRMPRSPRTVEIRSETAAEFWDVKSVEIVGRDWVNADFYLFPVPTE